MTAFFQSVKILLGFWLAIISLKNAKHLKEREVKYQCQYHVMLKIAEAFACQKTKKKKKNPFY